AAATSTGVTPGKLPGRVGDSPLVGCGAYADNLAGAASATGWGETLMKVVFSKTAVDLARSGLPAQAAAEAALSVLENRVGGLGGLILLDSEGRVGIAFNTPRMARAWATPQGQIVAQVDR
ncbi:MAG: isoaspartyl peptidase/L-asparaginase, partial [Chloroflexi bacterium]|nr:isoaspartyl peptidase/L-asparaginase [Chloroflexota bacterium]